MSLLDTDADPGGRRLLGASLLASVLIALAFVAFSWTRLASRGRLPDGAGEIALGVGTGWLSATVAFVPFLLAVLLVVADPSPRRIAVGAGLVYAVDLLLTVVRPVLGGFPRALDLTVLAVPLARVAGFLGVATAVWLAYHGGYDRLVSSAGDPDQHPLFALFADRWIGPALPLQRGLVAAGLAAVVSAGGLVLLGAFGDLLGAIARGGPTGSVTVSFTREAVYGVGIPLSQLPVEWLFEASFLLGVLFVTGPRLGLRDVLKAVGAVFVVQAAVKLAPMFLPPFDPVYLFGASGPLVTPLGDAVVLLGIAVAVRLASHGEPGTLGSRSPSSPSAD